MTKKEWNVLRIGDMVSWNKQIFTVNRFNFGCSQAEIISENGFKTWVGRTTIELVEKKTNSYTDDTLMQFGKYKGEKLIDVPASYLLWLYDNHKCYGELKDYIEENMDVLNNEIK
jgi:uncharacterized protein (DUF3820 family)